MHREATKNGFSSTNWLHYPDSPPHQVSGGIDLGGTSLREALYDAHMHEIQSHRPPKRVADGPEAVVLDMAHLTGAVTASMGMDREIIGIGMGSPGPLNSQTGTLGNLPNFPGREPTQHLTAQRNRAFTRPVEPGPSAGLLDAGLLPFLALQRALAVALPLPA